MTYTDRYTALTAQRAYTRRGLPALLAPYTMARPVVVPSQRRRVVRVEVSV